MPTCFDIDSVRQDAVIQSPFHFKRNDCSFPAFRVSVASQSPTEQVNLSCDLSHTSWITHSYYMRNLLFIICLRELTGNCFRELTHTHLTQINCKYHSLGPVTARHSFHRNKFDTLFAECARCRSSKFDRRRAQTGRTHSFLLYWNFWEIERAETDEANDWQRAPTVLRYSITGTSEIHVRIRMVETWRRNRFLLQSNWIKSPSRLQITTCHRHRPTLCKRMRRDAT